MRESTGVARIPIQATGGYLVATVQVDLTPAVMRQFQRDVLDRIHGTGARGLAVDLSGVDVMDSRDFEALRQLLAMTRLMGVASVLVGIRPGVASSLVELGLEVDDLTTCLSLDEALTLLDATVGDSVPASEDTDECDGSADSDSDGSRRDDGDPPGRLDER